MTMLDKIKNTKKLREAVLRPVVVVLFFVLLFGSHAIAKEAGKKASKHRKISAIEMPDNDISRDKKPKGVKVEVPRKVLDQITNIGRETFNEYLGSCDVIKNRDERDDCKNVKVERFLGPVFRIKAPKNRHLFVYLDLGASLYNFFMYDPAIDKVSAEPFYIYGKWMEGDDWGAPLVKPIVSFDDIDHDGSLELVIQERVHNGNMYNAVVYRYIEIKDDMSLNQILALETRFFDLYSNEDEGVIERKIVFFAKDSLRIDSFLMIQGSAPVKLGEVFIRRKKQGEPFKVEKRTVFKENYKDLLINAEEDDDEFLRNGYRFYY